MGYLVHQFPDEETKAFAGRWVESDLSSLPEDCFFITDFEKSKCFYFVVEDEISLDQIDSCNFNAEDDVFVASEKAYLNGLQYFIDGFEAFDIQKAIYSRIKLVDRKNSDEVMKIYRKLAQKYQSQALVYLVSDIQFGTWMGATPETLLQGNQSGMNSMALAGTKSTEQEQWTKKEREEHQYVVDYVKEKINQQSPQDLKISETYTVSKGAVYHLQTDFDFVVAPKHWNDLMQQLHPTPAVCGTPSHLAKEYILSNEPHDREFYAGLIGRKSKDELAVFVNLRCMQVLEKHFALYVGGGITLASDIAKELQETEDKSETLLSVIFDE